MTVTEALLIVLAGIGAGTINALVGSGTLITFPTLLAFGFPPITATVSNAIGQVPGNLSAAWGYRRELAGQWPRIRRQIPASLVGAVLGALLLLQLPEDAFLTIVPVLLTLALVLVIAQPAIQRWVRIRVASSGTELDLPTGRRMVLLLVATFLTAVYGGYFAAAQGVVLIALMGALVHEHIQRLNAAKNILTAVVNTVAAVSYVLLAADRIAWAAAGLIAVGTLIGGFVGASAGRRLPALALRLVIVALGCYAIWRILTLD